MPSPASGPASHAGQPPLRAGHVARWRRRRRPRTPGTRSKHDPEQPERAERTPSAQASRAPRAASPAPRAPGRGQRGRGDGARGLYAVHFYALPRPRGRPARPATPVRSPERPAGHPPWAQSALSRRPTGELLPPMRTPHRKRNRRRPTFASLAARPRRVLILSADVGEGHAAAARALARADRSLAEHVEVTVIDGLAAMGPCCARSSRTATACSCASSRGPTRSCTGCSSTSAGQRGRRGGCCACSARARWRADRRARPRRGRLHLPGGDRRARAAAPHRRRIDCPTVATITDLTGLFFWAQPGHRHAPRDVRRVDALGRADRRARQRAAGAPADLRRVPRSRAVRPRRAARSACPRSGRMVVVSGGGWGVGDIAGAVREFTKVPEVTQHRLPRRPQRAARDEAAPRLRSTNRACTCTGSPTRCPRSWPPPTCSCTRPAASPAWRHAPPALRSSPTACRSGTRA